MVSEGQVVGPGVGGRVALVTGGARGIGAAIAGRLAAAGAAVVVTDLDGDEAGRVAGGLAGSIPALGFGLDITSADDVADALDRANEVFGPVQVLVNNAGVDRPGPFLRSTVAEWDVLVAVNLTGTMRCTQAVLPGMVEGRWGRIVSVASDAGRVGAAGEAVYAATKGGVIAFTKAVAREVAADGVTVNCVCPGPIQSTMLDQLAAAEPRIYAAMVRAIPTGRVGTADDVAPVVAFLASEEAGYLTGQSVSISGGLTML